MSADHMTPESPSVIGWTAAPRHLIASDLFSDAEDDAPTRCEHDHPITESLCVLCEIRHERAGDRS